MERKILGRTDLELSVLGFGCGPLGDEYGTLDPREGQRAVDLAIDHGINYFDTAPYYGRTLSEERLGRYLEGKRDRAVISTKVGRYDRDLPHGFDFSAERVTRSVDESLRRLRTDVIDILLVHDIEFGDRDLIVHETLPALARARDAGKARFLGVTGYPLGILREVAAAGEVDVVLSYCHFNLLNTRMQEVLQPLASRAGVGLINASPLHMGILTHQGPPPWHPAPAEVRAAAQAAVEICEREGADLADLALRFALHAGSAASTLVGMRTEREVRRNLDALTASPDAALLARVLAALAPARDVEWPSGLPQNDDEAVLARRRGSAGLGPHAQEST